MNTQSNLARGEVTKVTLDVRMPDGTHVTREHEVGPETGGILFDDPLVHNMLAGNVNRDDQVWKEGTQIWNAAEAPSYLLLPRILADVPDPGAGAVRTCAAASGGTCVGGGQCRDTGKHCG